MRSVLTLNAGSSSLKFALYQAADLSLICKGQIENLGHLSDDSHTLFHARDAAGKALAEAEIAGHEHAAALRYLLDWLDRQYQGLRPAAVAHRIVHGGPRFAEPLRLSDGTLQALDTLTPLAPLHQPHGLAGARSMLALLPEVAQIACFDTAFHRSQPELQQRFALPDWYFQQGVRRYGFHGLSYQYIAQQLPAHLGAAAEGRVVVAHLGNGASACALLGRQSMASSMGFTALDGLMMGTRCGRIDPGVLIYLQETLGMSVSEISQLLYQQSGLLGVSGLSHDMRTLSASPEPAAQLAIALFCQQAAREIAALCVAIGGLDALVFTAGIGEHHPRVRAEICRQLQWLGLNLDSAANQANATRISTANSPISAWVIGTDEEAMLARAAAAYC